MESFDAYVGIFSAPDIAPAVYKSPDAQDKPVCGHPRTNFGLVAVPVSEVVKVILTGSWRQQFVWYVFRPKIATLLGK